MHVRKNDMVIVTAGKNRGDRGRILEVDPEKNRVKVHRINLVTKHKRPNPLTGEEGSLVEQEAWMHASNVSLYSEKLDAPVRTQARWVGKAGELFGTKKDAAQSFGAGHDQRIKKVRYAPKSGETFDKVGED